MTLGVTIGKFLPFHLGHRHLIRSARSQVDELVVIVAEHAGQTLTGAERARWIVEEHPDVEVIVTPDDLPEAPGPWASRALELLRGRVPDVAFTSEDYGAAWAAAMGCTHQSIDAARSAVPVRGVDIRRDLAGSWDLLAPAAKAGLCRRVVVAGAESTGKTTLAAVLAERMRTVWIPEWGRTYWEGRRHRPDQRWEAAEFVQIARQQATLEDALARSSHRVLIADTDALTTAVWAERYLGGVPDEVLAIAASREPDLTLVCAPDLPWVQDGTRESRQERRAMHERTLALCESLGRTWSLVTGDGEVRVEHALAAIGPLLGFPPILDGARP